MPKLREQDKPLIKVGKTGDVTDTNFMKQLPAHYLRALEDNPKLAACCRDVKNNYTYETFKTSDKLENPDMAVFTCTVCGRKHYRSAAGPGQR